MRRLLLLAFGFFCLVSAVEKRTLFAAEADLKKAEFFEKRIRPLLIAECYDCHSEDSIESGLRVDSLSGLIRGGERGPALVPGKPKESLLISAVQHSGQLHMPLKDKLSQKAIADLIQWVEAGAYWPNAKPISEIRKEAVGETGPLFTKAEQEFWAFQPPREPAVPQTRNREWAQQPLDQFVLARLEQADAEPASRADKRTLIRRATFDLIGLPPTSKEVEAFLADDSPDAFAKVIDRLLASPRYGERWGRHWLDVARYADSNGLDENLSYANAFRYRDYVIAAFNQDKPFDQFVQEQLAGDILANQPGAENRPEKITATGFLSIGAKMLAEDDQVKMQMDIIDEQLDTVGRTFMGLTLGCARCHSHKFDPIPIEDYYSLAGIFKSTKTMENFKVVARWQEQMLASPEEIQALEQQKQQIAKLDAEIKQIVKQADDRFLSAARKRSRDYLLASAIKNYHDQLLKSTGPIGADPGAYESHAAILVEAENFQTGNVKKATTGYGEGIGVIYNKGTLPNIAEYEIEVPKAGRYQLEIRYAAAQSRPVELSINGELVKKDAASAVTGSWYPKSQEWKVEGFYALKQGKNRVRLESKIPFPHIDKLLIAEPRTATEQPGGVLAEIPVPENLVSSLTLQWASLIKKSAEDPDSPFAIWNHLIQKGSVPETLSPTWERFSGLNELPEKERILKAADLYGTLFEEVLAEWEAYQKTEAGKETQGLPDPQREKLRQLLTDAKSLFALPSDRETWYAAPAQEKLAARREQKKKQEAALPVYPTAMSVSEQKPENLKVHLRGSHFTLGKEVPRQFLQIIEGEEQTPIDDQHSGRLQLAEWLTSGSHPLTARVMVNRIWRWHFGDGLVRTPDNFGKLGERPTHPELLDWLAVQFVKQGWSIKEMHRLIMLSSTYQMSSEYNPELAARDPENRLMWRVNRKRLEAEAIRDSILKVCGTLDLEMGGSMLGVENRKYVTSTRNVNPVIYQTNRRSVYLPIVRSALYQVLQAFDFADPSVLSGNRVHTTVAPQALFMMNSDFIMQQTSDFAEQVLHETHLDRAGKVKLVYERVYSRPASELEVSRALAYLNQYRQELEPLEMTPEEKEQRTWQSLCRVLISSNEFLFVD
jgi:cytochrome c553